MERSELTDRIFGLFGDKPFWNLASLRNELQQPDAWLRTVLSDYAETVQSGHYAHYFTLKPEWQDNLQESKAKGTKIDFEGKQEDEDEDDDEDDDMEEVGV